MHRQSKSMRKGREWKGCKALILASVLICALFHCGIALAQAGGQTDHEMKAGTNQEQVGSNATDPQCMVPLDDDDLILFPQSSNLPVYEAGASGLGMDGIDVSRYQPDFASSSWTNYQFAIVKATEGTSYTSPEMLRQASKVQQDGKLLGFYHYVSGTDAIAEADHFIDKVRPYLGKAILALDWEGSAISSGPSFAKRFLDHVYEQTGVKPLIYMSHSVTTSYDWSSVANAGYGLWLAHYYYRYDNSWLPSNVTDATSWYGYTEFLGYAQDPYVSGGMGAWDSKLIYQYSSTGMVGHSDGHLDIDKFYGTANDWYALAGNTVPFALSDSWSLSHESVTNTNATLRAKVTLSSSAQFEQAGVRVWDALGNQIIDHSEETTVNLDYMNIWYDVNKELGVTLGQGTTYTYQFWCVANGQTFTSETRSFTTDGPPQLSASWSTWVDNQTETNAVLQAKVTVSSTVQFTQAGIEIWDGQGNQVVNRSEGTTVNLDYMNIWYDVNGELGVSLVPGTRYTYRFWCVANGQTFSSETGSFCFEVYSTSIDGAVVEVSPATVSYVGSAVEPAVTITLEGRVLIAGVDYDVTYEANGGPGKAKVVVTGKGRYYGTVTGTFTIVRPNDGWIDLAGGKGYVKMGKLVKGWLDVGSSKYWFGDDGVMATGWTDVEVNGKAMHYYFNPASGNLARGTWMTIGGQKYYFRPSGNMATGFADIDDSGTTKKYYFDSEGQMLTGWQEIEVNGKLMRYYFRPAGSMATGWATIDGEKYYFRTSGNMATGWADVGGSKFHFDAEGRMQVGWQEISGRTYYFRPSGAMQTGTAKIGDFTYEFNGSGVLVREVLSAQAEESQDGEPIEVLEVEASEDDEQIDEPIGIADANVDEEAVVLE